MIKGVLRRGRSRASLNLLALSRGTGGATQGGCAADDVDGWTLADGSATCAPTKPVAQQVAGSAKLFHKKKEKPSGRAGMGGRSNIALCARGTPMVDGALPGRRVRLSR
ncbi:hypothetical protein COCSADRAFT_293387 [Bipolaris sorokiniana ND90Pr]|uniref:Uncharacterized protein n=1 Tax=Cochliobolus sativus (strain ND90Pr / ATCC 201652) TaxID=665912 RepID=M2SKU6_COCSN|nr:uncharacterized protein COCSADRAFT_293387 [Bipolaris sorokiniana ND90Pr]EMD67793.1 hypothetical protein COCSADRAFT_293387 [Bipolaris sorokiniana ND90Pr]